MILIWNILLCVVCLFVFKLNEEFNWIIIIIYI